MQKFSVCRHAGAVSLVLKVKCVCAGLNFTYRPVSNVSSSRIIQANLNPNITDGVSHGFWRPCCRVIYQYFRKTFT